MIEIISLALLVIVVFIVLFWLKKTLFIFGFFFKLFMLIMLVAVIGSVVFGYMVIKDANDFRNNFANSTNVFIVKDTLNDTSRFLSGVTINIQNKSYIPVPEKELLRLQGLYNKGDMDSDTAYYKIFVIDVQVFGSMKGFNVSDQNIDLNSTQLIQVMKSVDARDTVAQIVAAQNGVSKDAVLKQLNFNDDEIKGYILSYYLSSMFDPENIGKSLALLKDKNFEVYENTALFKAIRFIPDSLMKFALEF